jgi:hypothetical protein
MKTRIVSALRTGICGLFWLLPVPHSVAQTWVQLFPTGTPPATRGWHGTSGVYDAANQRMIIFAGRSAPLIDPLNDVWVLSHANGLGGQPQWLNLIANGAPGSPPFRAGHSAVYDSANNRMMIFGGCRSVCLPTLNDLWVLTSANGLGGTPTWSQLSPTGSPPAPRVQHAAVYDPSSNRMVIFAGQSGGGSPVGTFDDVWILTHANGLGGTPEWIELTVTGGPPEGQYGPTAVYDPASNRMIVFGGWESNAVWALTNANGLGGPSEWINLIAEDAVGAPPPRGWGSAVYDPALNRMTIFGGGGSLSDVWTLFDANGVSAVPSWKQRLPVGDESPAARCCHAAILDANSGRMTIFGGSHTSNFNDVWVLTGGILGDLDELIAATVARITSADPPGANGMIGKLTGGGGVAVRVTHAVLSFAAGEIDPAAYAMELLDALDKLDAFEHQVEAKINNGQIGEPEAPEIVELTVQIRDLIELLLINAPL